MRKGTVYFFTGLAGAGKTTIGGLFYRRLKAKKPNVIWFDGDKTRPVFGEDLSYSTEDRRRGAFRGFRMCKFLAEQGIDVVQCSICMYDDVREWNRANIENYREIYIRVKPETLLLRDQKGLYTSGKSVVGVDLPFDEPKTPDIVIQNDGEQTPEEIVEQLESAFHIGEDMDFHSMVERGRELYRNLQDQRSRDIFWARLRDDVEQSESSGIALSCLGECADHQGATIDQVVSSGDWNTSAKLVIYGTSRTGRITGQQLIDHNVPFFGFTSRSAEIFPDGLLGKPVITMEELFAHPDEYNVVIGAGSSDNGLVSFYDEVLEVLHEHHFPESHIVPYDRPRHLKMDPKIYFGFPELFHPGTAFVDGGCYDANSSRAFAQFCSDQYSKIIAFEPDEKNAAVCRKNAERFGLRNFELIQAGLSDHEGNSSLYSKGAASIVLEDEDSCSRKNSVSEIPLSTIDSVSKDTEIGFIKMDIEGSELEALRGAEQTILRDKPFVAISVYHRSGDVLTMMDFLQSLVPEYRFWLRHHTSRYDDTVLYAWYDGNG